MKMRKIVSSGVLGSDYKDMEAELDLWSGIDDDAFGCEDIFLVVDSYYVTEKYLQELGHMRFGNDRTCHLAYVDDLEAFAYPVDVLINYEFYADRAVYEELYRQSKVDMPELLLGVEYAPLRSMFRGIETRTQRKRVENVMISTGGSDLFHLSLGIMSEIESRTMPKSDDVGQNKALFGCTYHVLVGGMNEDKNEIREISSRISNVVLHESVSDMRSLIGAMDIVVSAAGSTQFEVCACGVPMVTYALADNQLRGMKALEERGLAVSIGDVRSFDSPSVSVSDLILKAVDGLATNYERRCEMGRQMQELIDGEGAERIMMRMVRHKN